MLLSIDRLKEFLSNATPDKRGKYLKADCPNCGEPTFTISLSDGHPCGCNRKSKCAWVGNIYSLAKLLGKQSLLHIEGNVGAIEKLENKLIKEVTKIDLETPTVKLPLGFERTYQDDYLASRGFTEYERFTVGRSQIHPRLKRNYVITAIEDNGEIKGYIGRHVWSKTKIEQENKKREAQGLPQILRYINSETDFGKLLFGYDFIKEGETKTVICVEGIFDAWNVNRLMNLYSQSSVVCNATFKCSVTQQQAYKWAKKGVENLILFYDSDVTTQIKRTASELQLYFNVLIAFNDNADVDAGDIDAEGLARVFNNLKTVSEFTSGKVVNLIK